MEVSMSEEYIQFRHLAVGDHFVKDSNPSEKWVKIPTKRISCCSQQNCKSIKDGRVEGLKPLSKVKKVEK